MAQDESPGRDDVWIRLFCPQLLPQAYGKTKRMFLIDLTLARCLGQGEGVDNHTLTPFPPLAWGKGLGIEG